jgi:hypothetical protein
MFGWTVKTTDETANVRKSADKAKYDNLRHTAFSLRKDVAATIEPQVGGKPSEEGKPPRTAGQAGHNLRGALWVDVDRYKSSAVIGPRFSVVGKAGHAHEEGGQFRGQTFPERPFMGPALLRNLDRFHRPWAGSVVT